MKLIKTEGHKQIIELEGSELTDLLQLASAVEHDFDDLEQEVLRLPFERVTELYEQLAHLISAATPKAG